MLAIRCLWWREVVRFARQPSRLVGAAGQPLVFWLLLGGGLSAAFHPPGFPSGTSYLAFLFPGTLALVILFTAIFSTISTVEDRRSGFLQGVLVSPVGRGTLVLGQALGGTTLAVLQGMLLLPLAPFVGITLGLGAIAATVCVMVVVAFGLTNLGLVIAWRSESTQGFHAIMNLILIPMWLLSGAFFPGTGVPALLGWVMVINPLTYGVAALRGCLVPGGAASDLVMGMGVSLGVAVAFGIAALAAAVVAARRSAVLSV